MKDKRDGLVRTTRPVRRVLRKTTRTRNRRISRRISRLDDAPDESCRTDRNATAKETRTVEVRLVSNDSNDTRALRSRRALDVAARWIRGTFSAASDGEPARASGWRSRTRRLGAEVCHRALRRPDAVPHVFRASPTATRRARRELKTSRTQNSSAESRRRGAGGPPAILTRLAMRVAPQQSDENATMRAPWRWADFDADARARLAVTAAVASHCTLHDGANTMPRGGVEPGRRPEATCAVLGNAFCAKQGVAAEPLLQPRSAKRRGSRLASLRDLAT